MTLCRFFLAVSAWKRRFLAAGLIIVSAMPMSRRNRATLGHANLKSQITNFKNSDISYPMKYTRFEDLPVWRDATELARLVFEFTLRDDFRRHPGLRNQLENSTLSISNNIAEGFERGSTNELLAFLYIARGSAGETRSMLRVMFGWSMFQDARSEIESLTVRSENISKQLYAWIEQLKRSGIRGQRHLGISNSTASVHSPKKGRAVQPE
jgi:four helix bundle protein